MTARTSNACSPVRSGDEPAFDCGWTGGTTVMDNTRKKKRIPVFIVLLLAVVSAVHVDTAKNAGCSDYLLFYARQSNINVLMQMIPVRIV